MKSTISKRTLARAKARLLPLVSAVILQWVLIPAGSHASERSATPAVAKVTKNHRLPLYKKLFFAAGALAAVATGLPQSSAQAFNLAGQAQDNALMNGKGFIPSVAATSVYAIPEQREHSFFGAAASRSLFASSDDAETQEAASEQEAVDLDASEPSPRPELLETGVDGDGLFYSIDDAKIEQLWQKYTTYFKRQYNCSEVAEKSREIFRANLKFIDELNNRFEAKSGSRPFGISPYTDVKREVFAQQFLMKSQLLPGLLGANNETLLVANLSEPLPEALDLTDKLTPIKNQGACGSCWAFTAVESAEARHTMQTGRKMRLSVQQLTSCDRSNSGCQGGRPQTAMAYMGAGVQLEADYPYRSGASGEQELCRYDPNKSALRVKRVDNQYGPCAGDTCRQKELGMQKLLVETGPFSVAINADWLQFYNGGVIDGECANDLGSLNHAVQVVGYRPGVWKMRNSWGTSWGERGYFYIRFGANQCGISNWVSAVLETEEGSWKPGPEPEPDPDNAASSLRAPLGVSLVLIALPLALRKYL